ncbi:MAG TPA: hypothetical protein VH234_00490 [Candidatus Saccharimonadales bacterium]|jgi:hypothetical protein|nr:hypothetical protein [Candidatus Saccharimonadales bacterium]
MPSTNSPERVTSILKLPATAQSLFDHYSHLHIQGLEISCPYHINTALRGKRRALVGKGRPEEIEAAAEQYLARFQMLAHGNQEQLERYLMACGLGVDCSGFAAWILNCVTLDAFHKPIQNCLKFPNLKRQLVGKVRPFENISANLLTNHTNSVKISDINQVRPGDLIRFINGGHVVVVSEVGLDKRQQVAYFKYMQSSVGYGNRRGVEENRVKVTNPAGYLLEQEWADKLLYQALVESSDDTRLTRLKALYRP